MDPTQLHCGSGVRYPFSSCRSLPIIFARLVGTTHPSPFLEVCCFVVFFSFSFGAVRSRAEHGTTSSVCKNLRLAPRSVPSVGFRTVSCRTSDVNLTPIVFLCDIHSSPRGPGRIPTVSRKTAFPSGTNLRLLRTPSYVRSLGLLPTVAIVCFPLKTTLCLPFFFLFYFPFLFAFSWVITRTGSFFSLTYVTSHSRYLPRSILTRFRPAFVLFSFLLIVFLRRSLVSNLYSQTLPVSLSSEVHIAMGGYIVEVSMVCEYVQHNVSNVHGTNEYTHMHAPLRDLDGDHYQQLRNKWFTLVEEAIKKLRLTQERYRNKSKRRLDRNFGNNHVSRKQRLIVMPILRLHRL